MIKDIASKNIINAMAQLKLASREELEDHLFNCRVNYMLISEEIESMIGDTLEEDEEYNLSLSERGNRLAQLQQ